LLLASAANAVEFNFVHKQVDFEAYFEDESYMAQSFTLKKSIRQNIIRGTSSVKTVLSTPTHSFSSSKKLISTNNRGNISAEKFVEMRAAGECLAFPSEIEETDEHGWELVTETDAIATYKHVAETNHEGTDILFTFDKETGDMLEMNGQKVLSYNERALQEEDFPMARECVLALSENRRDTRTEEQKKRNPEGMMLHINDNHHTVEEYKRKTLTTTRKVIGPDFLAQLTPGLKQFLQANPYILIKVIFTKMKFSDIPEMMNKQNAGFLGWFIENKMLMPPTHWCGGGNHYVTEGPSITFEDRSAYQEQIYPLLGPDPTSTPKYAHGSKDLIFCWNAPLVGSGCGDVPSSPQFKYTGVYDQPNAVSLKGTIIGLHKREDYWDVPVLPEISYLWVVTGWYGPLQLKYGKLIPSAEMHCRQHDLCPQSYKMYNTCACSKLCRDGAHKVEVTLGKFVQATLIQFMFAHDGPVSCFNLFKTCDKYQWLTNKCTQRHWSFEQIDGILDAVSYQSGYMTGSHESWRKDWFMKNNQGKIIADGNYYDQYEADFRLWGVSGYRNDNYGNKIICDLVKNNTKWRYPPCRRGPETAAVSGRPIFDEVWDVPEYAMRPTWNGIDNGMKNIQYKEYDEEGESPTEFNDDQYYGYNSINIAAEEFASSGDNGEANMLFVSIVNAYASGGDEFYTGKPDENEGETKNDSGNDGGIDPPRQNGGPQ